MPSYPAKVHTILFSAESAPGQPTNIEIQFRYGDKEARLKISVTAPQSGIVPEKEDVASEVQRAVEALLAAAQSPSGLPGFRCR